MTDLRFYFDGTNGTSVSGEVLLDVMISKEEKPKDIGQLKFKYSDSFFLHSACSYDHELAIMSLGLTMSAFTYKADGDKHARKALQFHRLRRPHYRKLPLRRSAKLRRLLRIHHCRKKAAGRYLSYPRRYTQPLLRRRVGQQRARSRGGISRPRRGLQGGSRRRL